MLWRDSVASSEVKIVKLSLIQCGYLSENYDYQNNCYMAILESFEDIWLNMWIQDW